MSDNVDNLPGGVRVVDLTLICHSPQLRESLDDSPHGVLRHTRPVLPQHGQLRLHAGIIHNMAGKQVTQGAEEVVAKEREARSVGQDHHSKVRVKVDDVRPSLCAVSRNNPPAVRENHLLALHQAWVVESLREKVTSNG